MDLKSSCILFELKSRPVTGIKIGDESDDAGGANVTTDVGFGGTVVAVNSPGVGVG